MTSNKLTVFCVLLSIVVLTIPAFVISWPVQSQDFPAFYAAAKLSMSPGLYSLAESEKVTSTFAPGRIWAVLRPLWYAAMLTPLGWLTPQHAFQAWQWLGILGVIIGICLLWQSPLALVPVLVFRPLWDMLETGQDIWFVLFELCLSLLLVRRQQTFWAGCAFALCCSLQPHLFLLLPVVLLTLGLWRFATGIGVTFGSLFVVSCLINGSDWLFRYLATTAENERRLHEQGTIAWSMLKEFPSPWIYCWVPTLVLVTWLIVRKLPVAFALASVPALGLLITPRMFAYDCVMLIPIIVLGFRYRFDLRMNQTAESEMWQRTS